MDMINFTNNDSFNAFASIFFVLTLIVAPIFAIFSIIERGGD